MTIAVRCFGALVMRNAAQRFALACLLGLAALPIAGIANAAHAPSIFHMVSNDGVHTDRFSSPEDAARESIRRADARYGYNWIYDHIEVASSHTWRIYYTYFSGGVLQGPFVYGSGVGKYWVCDATPMFGPGIASDSQGYPKVYTTTESMYANGCPAPAVDADKIPPCPSCSGGSSEGLVAGNPINLALQTKAQEEVDYRSPGPSPLTFTRRYDTNAFNDDAFMPNRTLGPRWRHNYDRLVSRITVGSVTTARVMRPDARILKFSLSGGLWVPDADIEDTLVQLTDGSGNPTGWSYTTTANDIETFDVDGRLLSVTDRNGLTQTLTYSTPSTPPSIASIAGLLITVTDTFGRTLQLTYDAQNRIQSVTDPASGVFTYTYNTSGMLASVTYPDTQSRGYVYGETANMQNVARTTHLTGIIDENGARFATYQYDNYGIAKLTEHAGGADSTSVTYTRNGSQCHLSVGYGCARDGEDTTVCLQTWGFEEQRHRGKRRIDRDRLRCQRQPHVACGLQR